MPDPIHQFEIHPLMPIKIFGWDVSFTNSSALHAAGCRSDRRRSSCCRCAARSLVPSRLQSMAEVGHEFVANMLRESTGAARR